MGYDIRKAFQTNKQAETEGKKLVLAKAKDGKPEAYLLIARKGNPAYKAYMARVFQENQMALQTKNEESEELAQSIFRDAAARYLLVGWGGIDWAGAENVPYTVETAREMLDVADIYKTVDSYSDEMSNYRDQQAKAEAGN